MPKQAFERKRSLPISGDWHKNHAVLAQTKRVIPETILHSTKQPSTPSVDGLVFHFERKKPVNRFV